MLATDTAATSIRIRRRLESEGHVRDALSHTAFKLLDTRRNLTSLTHLSTSSVHNSADYIDKVDSQKNGSNDGAGCWQCTVRPICVAFASKFLYRWE